LITVKDLRRNKSGQNLLCLSCLFCLQETFEKSFIKKPFFLWKKALGKKLPSAKKSGNMPQNIF